VRALALLLAGLALLGAAGCGNERPGRPIVFAAASLTEALPALGGARFSFAGSGALAEQIRRGAPADVFASASPRETGELYREGLVERPVALAYNRLAVIVSRANPAGIASVADLARPGVRLSVAGPDVPVGAYAVEALAALGLRRALGNVVSREPDVKDVVGKVALGEADAGIVYATDARAAETRLSTVPVPSRAQPRVRLEIAVVRGGHDRPGARRFVARATGPEGRAALAAAGFLPAAPS
jgi:molybdate transport system substrate-binding protein